MRVCLDLSPAVHHRAGIGRYAQELLAALLYVAPENDYVAFFNRAPEADLLPLRKHTAVLSFPWRDKPWRLRVLLAHLARTQQNHLFPNVELFHATDHLLPYFNHIPSVFTLYDLTFLLTDTHATLNRWYMQLIMPRFLHQATVITVISESTKRDIACHYTVDARKIHTIYPGNAAHFCPAVPEIIADIRARYKLPQRFILAVGTIEPRKNYITLLRAYQILQQQIPDVGLVIVGKKGWRSEPFYAELRALGLENHVVFPGFVTDADLPALYSAAAVLAYPSLYEGFGFPPLEAMACGTPVVASNVSSLPEVVGDAGILVPPRDVQALSVALHQILTTPRLVEELRIKGETQASQFTWEKTAIATAALYAQTTSI